MKKHFLIKSIRRNKRPANQEGWFEYTINPVDKAINALIKMVDEYNNGIKRTISIEVYSVEGNETAVITLRGPRSRVKAFPTALATTNFYECFSLREVEFPDIYV